MLRFLTGRKRAARARRRRDDVCGDAAAALLAPAPRAGMVNARRREANM
jgi:hypothetical protein